MLYIYKQYKYIYKHFKIMLNIYKQSKYIHKQNVVYIIERYFPMEYIYNKS